MRPDLKGHESCANKLVFSPDGKILASGSMDGAIRLWDIATGKNLAVLEGHTYFVRSVAFSPDGKTLVSGSADGTVRLWDVDPAKLKKATSANAKPPSNVSKRATEN